MLLEQVRDQPKERNEATEQGGGHIEVGRGNGRRPDGKNVSRHVELLRALVAPASAKRWTCSRKRIIV